jgi:hypothetical protein
MGILVVHRAVLRPFEHRDWEISPYLESGGVIEGGKGSSRRQHRAARDSNPPGPPSYELRNPESLSLGNCQRDNLSTEPSAETKSDGNGSGEEPFRPNPDVPSSVGRECSLSTASAVPSVEERQSYQWTYAPNPPESLKKPCQAQIEHGAMVPSHCNAAARNGSKYLCPDFNQGRFLASAPEESPRGGCRLMIEEQIPHLPRHSDTEYGRWDAQHTELSHQCIPQSGSSPLI